MNPMLFKNHNTLKDDGTLKSVSMKFGRGKNSVLNKFNDHFYLHLYDNSKGRNKSITLGLNEFEELTEIVKVYQAFKESFDMPNASNQNLRPLVLDGEQNGGVGSHQTPMQNCNQRATAGRLANEQAEEHTRPPYVVDCESLTPERGEVTTPLLFKPPPPVPAINEENSSMAPGSVGGLYSIRKRGPPPPYPGTCSSGKKKCDTDETNFDNALSKLVSEFAD